MVQRCTKEFQFLPVMVQSNTIYARSRNSSTEPSMEPLAPSDHCAESRVRIHRVPGRYQARIGARVVADSEDLLRVEEDDHAPVLYFPRPDVCWGHFVPGTLRTHCPWKGEASHFTIRVGREAAANGAWSYESPLAAVAALRGRVAFYSELVTVESAARRSLDEQSRSVSWLDRARVRPLLVSLVFVLLPLAAQGSLR
jgi:uncharacterized protein (DUF427 family)